MAETTAYLRQADVLPARADTMLSAGLTEDVARTAYLHASMFGWLKPAGNVSGVVKYSGDRQMRTRAVRDPVATSLHPCPAWPGEFRVRLGLRAPHPDRR
jgi:hypothetical protein